MNYKICSSCKKELPLENFTREKKSNDGLKYNCKACLAIRAVERYMTHPLTLEQKEKRKIYLKNYHQTHKKERREYVLKMKDRYNELKTKNDYPYRLLISTKKCELCGISEFEAKNISDEGIVVHHKDKNHKNNEISNLMALCVICHTKFHKEELSKGWYHKISKEWKSFVYGLAIKVTKINPDEVEYPKIVKKRAKMFYKIIKELQDEVV